MDGQDRSNKFRWIDLAPGLSYSRFPEIVSSGGSRWKLSSHGCIWLWLNGAGSGLLWGGQDRFVLKQGMYALTGGGMPADWACLRYPGEHELAVVVLDPKWFRQRLGADHIHPKVRAWLDQGCPVAFCGLMGLWENELLQALANVNKGQGPEALIAESKVLQWSAIRLFRTGSTNQAPTFCTTIKETNPVQKALAYLQNHYHEVLNLKSIAGKVGMAPHYLSRKVKAETGMTLQLHLRRLRIEKACELLSGGKSRITDVALDVGYQSLSHFAKAFREEMSETPRKWMLSQRER